MSQTPPPSGVPDDNTAAPGGHGPGGYGPGGYPGQYPPPGGQPPYAPQPPLSPADQRMFAVLAHLGGVFLSFLVPLVILLVFRGRGAFVEDQAKESLNFQITIAIAYVVGGITLFILVGGLILLAAALGSFVFGIVAAVRSSQGELYRYPCTLRLIT